MEAKFIKGLELSERYFVEVIQPLLAANFPDLCYSATRLGTGSDVIGFDTAQSRDHDWGPRATLFLSGEDLERKGPQIDQMFRDNLPTEFLGYPTNFGKNTDGTAKMELGEKGKIEHKIDLTTPEDFYDCILKFDPSDQISATDWVSVPDYNFLMITSGRVFHDGLGELTQIRQKLSYFPDDVWYYKLAVQWLRISQDEHLMGRCGQAADDLGSRLIAGRLVKDLMGLCFLMERKYAPYIKWFGSGFAQLESAETLIPIFTNVLSASTWQERQSFLVEAYEFSAEKFNTLGITDPIPAKVVQFFNRPFYVLFAERYFEAVRAKITGEEVLALPEKLGAFDQFTDSTDALKYIPELKKAYLGEK
jgi:hypothetical protein